jgi:uncharacterized protein YndB with AHSA1/START domain
MLKEKLAVRLGADLAASPERAYDVFVSEPTRWWPAEHTVNTSPIKTVVIEPKVGGRWYEEGEDGSQKEWGKVLALEPGKRVLLDWQMDGAYAFSPDFHTEVEARFTAAGGGCRVEFEHRGLEAYGDGAAQMREMLGSPGGWPLEVAGLVKACAAG